jgi:hypothetical protein
LAELEAVVESGWVSTLAAAKALVEIKESGLYKELGFPTFEGYVTERWKKTKQWAYDVCNWYEINVIAGIEDDPLSMAATRPLKPFREHPDNVRKVVAEAKKIAGKEEGSSPTAKDVEAAKRRVFPPKPKDAQETFSYVVNVYGPDVASIRAACNGSVGTISDEDEESLQVDVTNLHAFLRMVAEVAATKDTLKLGFSILKSSPTVASPPLAAAG